MLHRAAPDLEDLSFPIVQDAVGSVLGVVRSENEGIRVRLFHLWLFSARLRIWRVLLAISLGHFLVFSLRSMVVMV